MRVLLRLISLIALLAGAQALASSAPAALIRFQAPCGTANNVCFSSSSDEPLPSTLRSFSFTAPSAGRALVTFHGSMSCSFGLTSGSAVVDVVTQIGTDPNVVPTSGDPGALRHAITIVGTPNLTTDSFNLASTRAFAIAAGGVQTYYFKLASVRREAATACVFFNLAFSVEFVAASETAEIFFQQPCPRTPCTIIPASAPLPATVRSFTFNAPTAGRALVRLHGSMTCENVSDEAAGDPEADTRQFVSIRTQIGTDPDAAFEADDAGGARHAVVLLPEPDGTFDTLNLASTRAFVISSSGPRTYYFKLAFRPGMSLRGPLTKCAFYNLAFSVVFVPSSQPPIRFQAPCGNDPCMTILASQPLPTALRSFAFTAPRAGRALVTFHGAMECRNPTASPSVVDVVSQIGTDPNQAPSINDAGGLRHGIVLPAADADWTGYDTFNLASTRAFVISSAGTTTFYLKLAWLRFDAGECYPGNLAFSLVFV
jgi:hypothetical protein